MLFIVSFSQSYYHTPSSDNISKFSSLSLSR